MHSSFEMSTSSTDDGSKRSALDDDVKKKSALQAMAALCNSPELVTPPLLLEIPVISAYLKPFTVDLPPTFPFEILERAIVHMINGTTATMTTDECFSHIQQTLASHVCDDPLFSLLAGRIVMAQIYCHTHKRMVDNIMEIHNRNTKLIAPKFIQFVQQFQNEIESAIDETMDFQMPYEQIMAMRRLYLLSAERRQEKTMERPQHMYMRTAIGVRIYAYKETEQLHTNCPTATSAAATHNRNLLDESLETYRHLAIHQYFSFATPTLFNAGLCCNQLASCFLKQTPADSIEGIYDGLKETALISKHCGGVGESVHGIRGANSLIATSGGASHGLVPMLRLHNETARYCDQGGGRRKGGIAIYLETWHMDIVQVLNSFKLTGPEQSLVRDLFGAMWISDLFMQRVIKKESWTLFDPLSAPGLEKVWGNEFVHLYVKYEAQGLGVRTMPAADLFQMIMSLTVERGFPYILFKDACNAMSNHSHLGTIQSSNLCSEIVQYTSKDEIAVCNLASINLPAFLSILLPNGNGVDGNITNTHNNNNVVTDDYYTSARFCDFDWKALEQTCRVIVRDINHIIDGQFYPVEKARVSNMRHRPMGVGVQGLQNLFFKMNVGYCSGAGRAMNISVFEHIYFYLLKASNEEAIKYGPYISFTGSFFSQGILQKDLWEQHHRHPNLHMDIHKHNAQRQHKLMSTVAVNTVLKSHLRKDPPLLPWDELKHSIVSYGTRNSLLTAQMPTASTSHVLGNVESTEALYRNVYVRKVLAGEFLMLNQDLVRALQHQKQWNREMYERIAADGGSIQKITEIHPHIRHVFMTVWNHKQRDMLDMTADRAPFIDQSQSTNIFFGRSKETTDANLCEKSGKSVLYAWSLGLKTGMYYLRTEPVSNSFQYTISSTLVRSIASSSSSSLTAVSASHNVVDGLSPTEPKTETQSTTANTIPPQNNTDSSNHPAINNNNDDDTTLVNAGVCVRNADGECLSCSC